VKRRFPRDNRGRAVKQGPCDKCGYRQLQYEGDGSWLCNGLADPQHDDKPLIECPHYHIDGEPARTVVN
jgi:hypothetical protein